MYGNMDIFERNSSIEMLDEQDLITIDKLVLIYSDFIDNLDKFDWSSQSIGTLLVKSFFPMYYWSKDREADSLEFKNNLHKIFTFPHQEVSLMDIGQLYSTIDFRQLYETERRNYQWSPNPMMFQSFQKCIDKNSQKLPTENFKRYFKDEFNFPHLLESPCNDLNENQECFQYCSWHKELFSNFDKEEFLTLMKFAMPGRKFVLDPVGEAEKKLASKLFGADKLKNSTSKSYAPVFQMYFCYVKGKGFIGDDVELPQKLCDEFFPTPTDTGICLTKNLDIKQIFKTNQPYEVLLEQNLRKPSDKIKGNLWSESTLVIFTDGDPYSNWDLPMSYSRRSKSYLGDIKFQIHANTELANMIPERNYRVNTPSITLTPNHEYKIDVFPTGQISTRDFRALGLEHRKCHLTNKFSTSSMFKYYTEKNCKHECHVNHAKEVCNCTAWDFIMNSLDDNSETAECDVFGRTCFYSVIRNLTQSSNSQCNHCIKGCDEIVFGKVIKEKTSLLDMDVQLWETAEFANIEHDDNDTFMDKGFKNIFQSLSGMKYRDVRHQGFENPLIIVHLRIMRPEIDLLDTTYNAMDKFAMFGGNFGIFAEITGCSFLGVLNLIILILKLVPSFFQKSTK